MKKKILALILSVAAVGGFAIPALIDNYNENNITVMANADDEIKEDYSIEQFENMAAVSWINEDEILVLNGGTPVEGSTTYSYYCSVYNLKSKESKDYTNVNIGDVYGVSQDENYVLYSEPRFIPPDEEEWQKAYESGDLTYKQIKILNLKTGEVTSLDSYRDNSDAELFWLGNKVLINNWENWCIKGIDGKVYAEGKYTDGETCTVSGISDVKDCGDHLEGEFYAVDIESGKLVGINTSDCKERLVYDNGEFMTACVGGNYIVKDNGWEKGKNSDKEDYDIQNDPDARWSFSILDKSGAEKHKIYMPQNGISGIAEISPSGDKAVFFENEAFLAKRADKEILKALDLNSGEVKDIARINDLNSKKLVNIDEYKENTEANKSVFTFPSKFMWDKNGKRVMFTYYFSDRNSEDEMTNTYIVTFNK